MANDEPTGRPVQADQFRLDDKVVIITGASSGLGEVCAHELAAAGARLTICARRKSHLDKTALALNRASRVCVAVEADVTSEADCARAVRRTIEEFGRVDVLVNSAGIATAVPALREHPEDFMRVVNTNLLGSYLMARECARAMAPGSAIVNLGSILGATTAKLPQAAYCSTKAAIVGLTRDLAQQWTGRRGIRVNAVAPGFVPTEMTDEYPDGYLDDMLQRIPAGRLGRAEEIAAAIIFLASDAASYISGVVLPVDGGLLTG